MAVTKVRVTIEYELELSDIPARAKDQVEMERQEWLKPGNNVLEQLLSEGESRAILAITTL